jgi:hypothetical protein
VHLPYVAVKRVSATTVVVVGVLRAGGRLDFDEPGTAVQEERPDVKPRAVAFDRGRVQHRRRKIGTASSNKPTLFSF